VLIEVLPSILVLHLKRFLYDTTVRGVVKIGKPVQFGPDLDVPLGTLFHLSRPAAAEAKNECLIGMVGLDIMAPAARRPARYTLYGVLYHHGVSAGGGHYTLDVLHPNRDGVTRGGSNTSNGGTGGEAWLHIDDETVSPVRHEDVFGGNGNERADDRCAYLLFYRRATPTRT
jgi:ubiquitin carboxyl-terminal hydrolase 10